MIAVSTSFAHSVHNGVLNFMQGEMKEKYKDIIYYRSRI